MYRNSSYEQDFAKGMQDFRARQAFMYELLSSSNEEIQVEDALRIVIQRMGVSEFSKLVGMSKQTIDKFLKGSRNPKRSTIDRLLEPFGLETKLSIQLRTA